MAISTSLIKELREKTGVGIMDCKEALEECDGNIDNAIDHLRKKGIATAKKRGGRVTSQGQVQSYIHAGGKIGVLVEVNCETDFTGKTEAFTNFAKDMAIQVAATNPIAIDREGVPKDILEKEKEIYSIQARESGKPENVIDRIVEGRLKKFYSEACLLHQPFVKDPDITVQDVLNEVMAKTGENIVVRRITRFQLGESDD
ncbi:MAG: translation elongation factor Ts [Thermodesulfobacteriota bacterium]|nr:translation elongation factor Ts [Thermodesulfobacteriota bacterium]